MTMTPIDPSRLPSPEIGAARPVIRPMAMHPYAVSPECRERRCIYRIRINELALRTFIQHGQNPEAVMIVDVAIETIGGVEERYREFAEACHRHDDRPFHGFDYWRKQA
jgi:hypothetical protein